MRGESASDDVAFPIYSPPRNCGGGVISEIWIFFQAFQFITTPPIYDFGKIFFQDTENCPKSFKFMQFLAKFRPFFPIFPPPPFITTPQFRILTEISNPTCLLYPPPLQLRWGEYDTKRQ